LVEAFGTRGTMRARRAKCNAVRDRCASQFMDYDLGYFDDEAGRVEPIADPFGSKVLPMCSV
jgi:hypothetical protein